MLPLMMSLGAFAHDAKIGGICYNLNSTTKEASVTFGGSYYDGQEKYQGAVNIPSTVISDGITYNVTSIGDCAFSESLGTHDNDLTSITIPNSVTSIGKWAFAGCWKLSSVTIPNSVTSIGASAFRGCEKLETVNIPNGVTSIAEETFIDCAFSSITIPNSVTSIGAQAFQQCRNLTSITIPNSVTSIGAQAFYGCPYLKSINVPNSVTEIGSRAFHGTRWFCDQPFGLTYINSVLYSCYEVDNWQETIVIKDGTQSIAGNAFVGSGVKSVTIPNSVKSIGDNAFEGTMLTSVTIPSSVTSIGKEAFSKCENLTKVKMPESLKSIGDMAFQFCYKLSSVTIPNSVTNLGSGAFSYSGLKSVTIGNSLTSIGSETFWGCASLTTITFGNSVTRIEEKAFYDCDGLTSIIIPNSVESLGRRSFTDCTNLKSVTIPASVKAIASGTFSNCTNLTSVTNLATTPQKIDAQTFSIYGTLHVLPGCKAAYEAAENWKNFTIVEDAEPQATAKAIMELINSIGKVENTEACKTKIEAARAAYDALSNEQQALVKNYNILVEAENAYSKFGASTGITNVNADNTPKDAKYLENGKIVIVKNGKRFNINGL